MLPRPGLVIALALGVLLCAAAALPFMVGPYGVKFATRILVVAIFVLSLDLLIGITGLVSFGHAMFFGLGAYAVYFVSPASEPANLLLAFACALGLSGAAAAAVGALAVLTRGFYFIMVTLAFGEMLFSLFHDSDIAGGSDGAYIDVKPRLALGATTFLDLEGRTALFFFCLALLIACYLGLLALCRSPFGRVLQGIRFNETRVAALGFNTYLYRLGAFTIAGGIAGLAGALFASIDGYVTPDLFGWRQSGFAILALVLGGVSTLSGAVFGALAYGGLEEILKTASLVGPIAAHWSLALGIILIGAVLAAPHGIAGWLAPSPAIPRDGAGDNVPLVRTGSDPAKAPRLETQALSRRFGGLLAVDDVSLVLEPNRVHAIIGPNGAGKTTFINMLSGALRPSSGRLLLDGVDVTGRPPHVMARRGVGRTYQITNVILPFTAFDNCRLAAQGHARGATGNAGECAAETAIARAALQQVGLGERIHAIAAHLSHGEQRQLEIAMLIASGARLLVLDEPLAGMGPEETERVTALLRRLAVNHTVVLIEHDLDAVFAVADTLTVLLGGRLLAHGDPQTIRRDAAVREAYLGQYGAEEPLA